VNCYFIGLPGGEDFLFDSSPSPAEELFFIHRHDLLGLDISLCVKEQAQADDYGKEFQQKIRGASVRTFS
jgi:hypothetical protein